MINNKILINHIKSFTTFEWLIFIKILENKTDEELVKIEPNQVERFNLQNTNWYSKLLDLALRLSNYEKTKVKLDILPRTNDYRKFISLYLESYDKESNFKDDLDHSLDLALSKYVYEQLKNYAPSINNLGRLIELYGSKEALFKELFGLTPKQILYFYTLNNAKHDIYHPFDFTNMLRLLVEYDKNINSKKLKKFLDIFSITVKMYRFKAKELGITKNTMKSKRLIETYPIIALNNNHYLIPSINVLLTALTYKIFDVINEQQNNPQRFKTKFGNTFEKYIRNLTKFSHNEYFYECDKLITEKNEEKAEFYLLKDNACLVIESKLLHIDEEMILNKSAKDLESKFQDTIEKALNQLNSCFKKLNVEKQYGIIVIHTHIPLLENFIKLFKYKTKYNFLDNVMIMSILDYEVIIHNPLNKIIEYFKLPNDNNKSQIALYFEQKNSFLENSYLNLIEELKNTIEGKK